MKNWFTQHPHAMDESYAQHMLFSIRCALILFFAGMVAFLHAIFPFLCTNTCSNIVAKLVGNYCKGPRCQDFLNKLRVHLPVCAQSSLDCCRGKKDNHDG